MTWLTAATLRGETSMWCASSNTKEEQWRVEGGQGRENSLWDSAVFLTGHSSYDTIETLSSRWENRSKVQHNFTMITLAWSLHCLQPERREWSGQVETRINNNLCSGAEWGKEVAGTADKGSTGMLGNTDMESQKKRVGERNVRRLSLFCVKPLKCCLHIMITRTRVIIVINNEKEWEHSVTFVCRYLLVLLNDEQIIQALLYTSERSLLLYY